MEIKKLAKNQTTKYVVIGAIGVVALSIVYFGILNPLFKWTGIKDSEIDKKAKKLLGVAKTQEMWNPTFYKGRENQISFQNKGTESSNIAKNIYGSFSWLGDNETKINSMLGLIRTKADLSYVVWQYSNLYQKDLLTELFDRLSSQEFVIAMGKVSNLKTSL